MSKSDLDLMSFTLPVNERMLKQRETSTYFGMWILCNTGIMFPRCSYSVRGITRRASAPDQEVHMDSAKEIWLVHL